MLCKGVRYLDARGATATRADFCGRKTTDDQVGTGNHTYELIRDFLKLPDGQSFGLVSRVATDSQDRVYVFQRKDPPVVVFDRDGKVSRCLGHRRGHRPARAEDRRRHRLHHRSLRLGREVVHAGRQPLLELGQRGVHSDTGCTGSPWLALRAAGPFNHPTEMMAHPNGDIYVTDGYRNARVHRFTRDGRSSSHGARRARREGEFHLPHSIAFDPDGKLYVADRANKRIQIFSPEGDFLGMWTGMGGPNDITRGKDGTFYIAEQEDGDKPAYVCVRDAKGTVLARMESRHVHGVGVDSRGDIYAGLTQDRSVDKFVRTG